MTTLLELATRCEAATGADRDLDAKVFDTLCIEPSRDHGSIYPAYAYTASLDAAMTLVPEGWWWSTGDCSVSADASVGPDVAHCDKMTLVRFDAGIHCDLPHPSTPALALCAAALRAHHALNEGSQA